MVTMIAPLMAARSQPGHSMRQGEMFNKPRKHTELKGHGYAARPGSGPSGETCKTCAHLQRRQGSSATWNKCGLVKRGFSRDTDIRLDAPACLWWRAHDNDNET
ncbi:MAG TPA: hypothetical protein VIR56_03375 [Solimonas sp.]